MSKTNPESVYPESRRKVNENSNYVPKEIVNQIRKNSHEEGFVVYRSRTESIFRQVDFIKEPKQKRKSLISRKSFARKRNSPRSSNLVDTHNFTDSNTRSSTTSKRFTPQDTPISDSSFS